MNTNDRNSYQDINELVEIIYNDKYNHYLINKTIFKVLEVLKKEFKNKKINQYKKINSLLKMFETKEIRMGYYKEDYKNSFYNSYIVFFVNGTEKKFYFKESFEEEKIINNSEELNKEEILNHLKNKIELFKELEKIEEKCDFLKDSYYYCYQEFFNINYKGKLLRM